MENLTLSAQRGSIRKWFSEFDLDFEKSGEFPRTSGDIRAHDLRSTDRTDNLAP
jgi:hypothetical protein